MPVPEVVMTLAETVAQTYSYTLDRLHQLVLPVMPSMTNALLDAFLAAGY